MFLTGSLCGMRRNNAIALETQQTVKRSSDSDRNVTRRPVRITRGRANRNHRPATKIAIMFLYVRGFPSSSYTDVNVGRTSWAISGIHGEKKWRRRNFDVGCGNSFRTLWSCCVVLVMACRAVCVCACVCVRAACVCAWPCVCVCVWMDVACRLLWNGLCKRELFSLDI